MKNSAKIVRHKACFTIESFDAKGEQLAQGGEPFQVAVRGASVMRARIEDKEDGAYLVHFTPSTSGSYDFTVNASTNRHPDWSTHRSHRGAKRRSYNRAVNARTNHHPDGSTHRSCRGAKRRGVQRSRPRS